VRRGLPANVKLPRVQIDIRAAQAEQLAPPQPRRQRQNIEGFEPFALDDLQEVPGVLDGQCQELVRMTSCWVARVIAT
jgi:hypothetical protein